MDPTSGAVSAEEADRLVRSDERAGEERHMLDIRRRYQHSLRPAIRAACWSASTTRRGPFAANTRGLGHRT